MQQQSLSSRLHKGLQVDDPVTVTRPPNKNTTSGRTNSHHSRQSTAALQGVVAYTGPVHFIDNNNNNNNSGSSQSSSKHDDWIGIRLTGPSVGLGKNNGTVQGHRYFTCPEQCGIFVRTSAVQKRHLTHLEALRLKRELLAQQQQQQQQKATTTTTTVTQAYKAAVDSEPLSLLSPPPSVAESPSSSSGLRRPGLAYVELSSDTHTTPSKNPARPNVVTPPSLTTTMSPSNVHEHQGKDLRQKREMLQERIAILKNDKDDHHHGHHRDQELSSPRAVAEVVVAATTKSPSSTTHTAWSTAQSPKNSNETETAGKKSTTTMQGKGHNNKVQISLQALLDQKTQQQKLHSKQQLQQQNTELFLLHQKLMHTQQEALMAQDLVLEMEDERQELRKTILLVNQNNRALQDQLHKALRQLAETKAQLTNMQRVQSSSSVLPVVEEATVQTTSPMMQPVTVIENGGGGGGGNDNDNVPTTPPENRQVDDSWQLHAVIHNLRQQLSQSQQQALLVAEQTRVQQEKLQRENQQLSAQYDSSQQETNDDFWIQHQPLSLTDGSESSFSEERDQEIRDLRDQLEQSQRLVDNLKSKLDRQQQTIMMNRAVDQDFKFYCLRP